jgi:cardiolipin synthase
VLTVPNAISFARLLGVPLFLWLFLGPRSDGWALAVLFIGATTDWVDGFLARRLGQVSRLGELLDPFVDRLYIVATLLALTAREILPLWFTAALLLREVVMSLCLIALRRHGYGPPQVHYAGKTGTFVLLLAFPVLLVPLVAPGLATLAHAVGWGLAWWGLAIYWLAGVLYLGQAAGLIRDARRAGPDAGDRTVVRA